MSDDECSQCHEVLPSALVLPLRQICRFMTESGNCPHAQAADPLLPNKAVSSKKRGAPRQYDLIKDHKLADDWRCAKASGLTKKDFAKETGRRLADICAAIERERKRGKKRSIPAE